MKKSPSDFVYGIEYNFKNPTGATFGKAPDLDSVYLLSSVGKVPVNIQKCAYWEGFRHPFSLLCENTPFRVTFYYETYNQLMMADFLTNKNVITLVGLARVYGAIQRYNGFTHPDPSEQIAFEERIDYSHPITGGLIVDDAIGIYVRTDTLTLPSGVSEPTQKDLLCYPYVFYFDNDVSFETGGVGYYHWRVTDIDISNVRKNSKPFTNMVHLTQSDNSDDNVVPFFIMNWGTCIPNIVRDKFNVMF